MVDPAKVKGLLELLSARVRGCARGEEYVAVAQNALEAGFDTPTTLRLAVEDPPYFTPDLDRRLGEMLRECEIEEPTSDVTLIRHAQQVAAEIVAGALPPRMGAERISEIFTLDYTPEGFHSWTTIAEGLWCAYCRDSATAGHPSFEAAIVAEAEAILSVAV